MPQATDAALDDRHIYLLINNKVWILNRLTLNVLLAKEIIADITHISSSFDMICNFPHPLAETDQRTSIVFNNNVSYIKHSNTNGKYLRQDFKQYFHEETMKVNMKFFLAKTPVILFNKVKFYSR